MIPTFDELLDRILTDYRNQDVDVDKMLFVKSSCLASALWGIRKEQARIEKQIFPDTADAENLHHHGFIRGLPDIAGESDAAYLVRLLDWLRNPPAGGNKTDYERWATSITKCPSFCYPLALGNGTVDLVIMASEALTGSETPSSSARIGFTTSVSAGKLVDGTADFTAAARPVAVGDIVRNTITGAETHVTVVDSATQLSLYDDIFKYVGENYLAHFHTGTNTSTSDKKLIDSAGAFNDGTYTVRKGDVVINLTDNTTTTVVSMDSATQLTLADDIFTAIGKKSVVKSLLARVREYIDYTRTTGHKGLRILSPTFLTQDVTMTVSGPCDKVQTEADIAAYMAQQIPNQTLVRKQIEAIAIQNGATEPNITVPAANVPAVNYQTIRAGAISVT